MKKLLTVLFLLLLFFNHSKSQAQGCATDAFNQEKLTGCIECKTLADEFEAQYAQALLQAQANHFKQQSWGTRTRYCIPVVVHVVHDGNPNTPDQISAEQVQSQFEVLFNDYRKKPGTKGVGGGIDMEIEFSLATINPDGQPTNGINYIENAEWASLNRNTEDAALKDATAWARDKYLNVWLVQRIEGVNEFEILGYAQFPNMPAVGDGIVIRSDCWGTMGTAGGPAGTNKFGRTCVHEFGHWLNLFHPFQTQGADPNGCGTSTNCAANNDRVCDTPPTANANFGSMTDRTNTCNNDSPDLPDNPRIFMDYLDDEHLNLFTNGQKLRAYTTLNNTNFPRRNKLWQDANLQATGTGKYKKPVADFFTNNPVSCAGCTVTFYDYSKGMPDNFEWSFPGGTPATSTEAMPVVVYSSPGTYSVTLKVTNLSGQSDILTKENIVTVPNVRLSLPVEESFESTTFPPNGWAVENPDVASKWSKTWQHINSGAFNSSGGSARIQCFEYPDYNQVDALITPWIDCRNLVQAQMEFSIAYAPYNDGAVKPIDYNDTLTVYASTDGGNTWTSVYRKGGKELAPRGSSVNAELTSPPPTNYWRKENLVADTLNPSALNIILRQPYVRLKFEVKNGFGNNVYLDDFKLFGDTIIPQVDTTISVTPVRPAPTAYLAPNPTQNRQTELCLTLYQANDFEFMVFDLQGKQIRHTIQPNLQPGTHQFPLDFSALPAGMYFIQGKAGIHRFYQKVMLD